MKPIGTYSAFVKAAGTIYVSGQIALDSETGELQSDTLDVEVRQVFDNLKSVVNTAGATLKDVVKMTVYVTDLSCFDTVNMIMKDYFEAPFPARALIEVKGLPKGASIEMDAIVVPELL